MIVKFLWIIIIENIIIWYNFNFCKSFNKVRKKYLLRILFFLLKGGNVVDKKKNVFNDEYLKMLI